jgi:hypothetical protein
MKPRHLAAAFFSLLMLYLLAFGPVAALVQRSVRVTGEGEVVDGSGMLPIVEVVYAPVLWICKQYPKVGKPIIWYVNVWREMVD